MMLQLIKQGTLSSKKRNRRWGFDSQERTLFLFDNCLVVCKATTTSNYTVKDVVYLNQVTLLSVEEPGSKTFKHALKLRAGGTGAKWFVFAAKEETEKETWVQAFLEERKIAMRTTAAGTNPTARLSQRDYIPEKARKKSGIVSSKK